MLKQNGFQDLSKCFNEALSTKHSKGVLLIEYKLSIAYNIGITCLTKQFSEKIYFF